MVLSFKHVNLCSNTTGTQILCTLTEFECVFLSMLECNWNPPVKVKVTVI